MDELRSIIDFERFLPSLDPVFAGRSGYYWSGTSDAGDDGYGWYVGFSYGNSGVLKKNGTYYSRCVRGGPFWPSDPTSVLKINSTGTIKDTHRGYLWQKAGDGAKHTKDSASSYCGGLELDGYTDWRLPTIEELQTIIDNTRYDPALAIDFFQGASDWYWSSSAYASNPYLAWYVSFYQGTVHWDSNDLPLFVRCVRGGGATDSRSLAVLKSGTGSGRVISTPDGIDCGNDCNERFDSATPVNLEASPDPDSSFSGWSGGGCSGADLCRPVLEGNIIITAFFEKDRRFGISGTVMKGV